MQTSHVTGFTPLTTARFVGQGAIWGTSFTFIQVANRGLSPSLVVLSRLVLATLALWLFCRIRRESLVRGPRAWGHTAVAAVLGNVAPYLALTWGELRTSAGVAGVLIGATPLLTILIAVAAIPTERVGRTALAGFLLAFVGVVVVVNPASGGAGALSANLACLGAAASYACGYVYVRRYLNAPTTTPLGAATSQLLAACLVQAAVTPLFGATVGELTPAIIAAVAALGLFATGYATVVYFHLIRDLGAGLAAAVDYLVPVFAVLVGTIFGGEHLTPGLAAGALLILIGMAIAEGRLHSAIRRRLRRPAPTGLRAQTPHEKCETGT